MRTTLKAAGALAVLLTLQSSRLDAQSTSSTPATTAAQLADLALEDLLNVKVYTASKFVQDVAQAPASVSIITAEEIRTHGYRTLADVLRSVRGFYVTNDRAYSYVGVRGFSRPGDYNSRVLLMVNGHRLNDNIFEQALIGSESPIDIAAIERVEVVRGPSSSLYGTSAFFAVVNILTRSGRGLNGGEATARLGSQQLRSGSVVAGGRTSGGVEGMIAIAGNDSQGNDRLYFPEFDHPTTHDGIARAADADRGGNLFGSASRGGLVLQGGFGSRTKTIPTGSFGTVFGDSRAETSDARSFVDLQYSRRLERRSTVQGRVAFDHYAYDGVFPYTTGLFDDEARGAWITTEGSLIHQFERHGLTAGVEYRRHLRQNQYAADETGVLLDDRRSSDTAGLYIEDEIRLRPGVLLNAGLRWDHYYAMFGSTLNPRLGLIVSPFEGASLKGLYGRAFRAPNPYEMYYDRNAISATLKPERIETYEGVWEQRVSRNVRVTGSVFHYRARDLIAQQTGSDTLDGLFYRNAETATATGAEMEFQIELPGRFHGRAAHTVQRVTDAQTGARLSNSPSSLAMLALDAPIGDTGFLIAFDGHRVGSRRTVFGEVVDGALVSNISISRRAAARGAGVSLSIRNLFNVDYQDPASVEHTQSTIPQDGRTATLSVSWRF